MPMRNASWASTGSASSIISIARPYPINRGRVHDAPESADSATLAKAIRNLALSEAIRRSQANARDAPAPAAVPLTAAITGLGMLVTVLISGL